MVVHGDTFPMNKTTRFNPDSYGYKVTVELPNMNLTILFQNEDCLKNEDGEVVGIDKEVIEKRILSEYRSSLSTGGVQPDGFKLVDYKMVRRKHRFKTITRWSRG